ncbi:MAG: hypothetical protein JW839_02050 [Candidatus Lokiarchaeota archaeon]|nr:hypothetical protein [Candidatus Lokiarchaeota archaeon]
MNRFCPICSKTVSLDEIKRYKTCKACYDKEHPLFTLGKGSLAIQICPTCMRYRSIDEEDKAWNVPAVKAYKEVWIQAIYQFIVARIPGHEKLDFFIDFKHEPGVLDSGRKKVVWLELAGRERDEAEPREATAMVQLLYSVGTCNECAQKRVGYHNSVIQLRAGMKRAKSDAMIEQMRHDVELLAAQTHFHGTAPVTSIERVPGGVDIKLASKKLGKVVAGQLRKKYCVGIKESFKLVGVDKGTGADLTRQFYGIRLLPFFPGDVLLLPRSGEPCLVLKTTSAMIHLLSLASGKVEHAKPEAFTEESIVFRSETDQLSQFQVVSLDEADGTMNLMDLATYEERVEALRPWLGVEADGGTITGFHFADSLYLIPLAPGDVDAHVDASCGGGPDDGGGDGDGDGAGDEEGSGADGPGE